MVEKANGDLRMYLDPVHLNKYVIPDRFPIPVAKKLILKLQGKKITILESIDINDFLWYKCKSRSLSKDEWENFWRNRYWNILDDFIIGGADEQEHDDKLNQVLKRA